MSLIEFLMREVEPEQIPVAGPMAISPVVVDANALASDAFYAAQHDGHSALLDAANLGVIRLFAPVHIYDRVYSLLPELAYGSRLALLEEAVRLWESEYLRHVRFVDVEDAAVDDPRVDTVALRDPEDAPVAKLAALIGPCRLMSQDRDFVSLGGGAGADWRPVAVAGRRAMLPTQAVVASVVPASLIHSGASSSVAFLRARPEWRWPVAVVAIALVGFIGWKMWKADRSTWSESARRLAADVAQKAQPHIERYQHAREVLRQATIVPAQGADPLNHVAHLLASSPRPLHMTDISRALTARLDHVQLTAPRVGALLRGARCFHRNRNGSWQLGFLAAPWQPRPAAVVVIEQI
ncbi:MAG TPA: hypothetical protein VF160_08175 [Candidatus Dormibacteraeota bacterium]